MQLILFCCLAIGGEFSELKTTTSTPLRPASHLMAMALPFISAHLCVCVLARSRFARPVAPQVKRARPIA